MIHHPDFKEKRFRFQIFKILAIIFLSPSAVFFKSPWYSEVLGLGVKNVLKKIGSNHYFTLADCVPGSETGLTAPRYKREGRGPERSRDWPGVTQPVHEQHASGDTRSPAVSAGRCDLQEDAALRARAPVPTPFGARCQLSL